MDPKAFVGDFADVAVLLPLAAAVAFLLGAAGWWRGAAAWATAVGGVLLCVLALKLGLAALAAEGLLPRQASPSGYVAVACVAYGGLGVLLLQGRRPGAAGAAWPLAVAVAIGLARAKPWMHSPAEVLAGAMVGLLGVAALALLAEPRPTLRPWPILAAAAAMMPLFLGVRAPAEGAIKHAARSS